MARIRKTHDMATIYKNSAPTSVRAQSNFQSLTNFQITVKEGQGKMVLCGSHGLNGHSSAIRLECGRVGHLNFADAISTRAQERLQI